MQICNLFQNQQSQDSSLEEEVVRLKQELQQKSKVDEEEFSAELRECRKIEMESRVSSIEDCNYTHCSMSYCICALLILLATAIVSVFVLMVYHTPLVCVCF